MLELPGGRVYVRRLDEILNELGPANRKRVLGWLADRRVSNERISEALRAAGHEITHGTIRNERVRRGLR